MRYNNFEFKFQTKSEFKQWRRKEKQKKRKEKKASQSARPVRHRGLASPMRPPCIGAHARGPQTGPPRRSRPLTLVCFAYCRCQPGPVRQPHRHRVIFSTPTPNPSLRPSTDSAGRSGPGGHARGMTLSSLAPRSRNLTRAV